MSNISFNFLSNSFLFKDDGSAIHCRSLSEIENELDKYRSYINSNKDELDKECINDGDKSIALSDFRSIQYLPNINEIKSKALFLNKFIIEDPLFATSFRNINIINEDRLLRGYQILTDEKLKTDLMSKINYMKQLTPGVDSRVQYIKFYPLSCFIFL